MDKIRKICRSADWKGMQSGNAGNADAGRGLFFVGAFFFYRNHV
jgi:hypothetical protein